VRPSRGEVPALVAGVPRPGRRPAPGSRSPSTAGSRPWPRSPRRPRPCPALRRHAPGRGVRPRPNRLEVLVVTDGGLRRLGLRG
jgi:hypothetical protein